MPWSACQSPSVPRGLYPDLPRLQERERRGCAAAFKKNLWLEACDARRRSRPPSRCKSDGWDLGSVAVGTSFLCLSRFKAEHVDRTPGHTGLHLAASCCPQRVHKSGCSERAAINRLKSAVSGRVGGDIAAAWRPARTISGDALILTSTRSRGEATPRK